MLNKYLILDKLPGIKNKFAGGIRYCIFSYLVLIYLVAGCSTGKMSVKDLFRDLPGTYKVEYEPFSTVIATETLELKTDGTFKQVFTPTVGTGWKHTGTWELLEFEDGSKCLSLLVARMGLNDSSNRVRIDEKYINTTLPISRWGASIKLTIEDDLGYYYRKMKKSSP